MTALTRQVTKNCHDHGVATTCACCYAKSARTNPVLVWPAHDRGYATGYARGGLGIPTLSEFIIFSISVFSIHDQLAGRGLLLVLRYAFKLLQRQRDRS